MNNPVCSYEECGKEIADEETFIELGGGTVHHGEPQSDAGGGIFHTDCAKAYIQKIYIDM